MIKVTETKEHMCDSCGKKAKQKKHRGKTFNGWFKINKGLYLTFRPKEDNIFSLKEKNVFHTNADLDFCSRGCLMKYMQETLNNISKTVKRVRNESKK